MVWEITHYAGNLVYSAISTFYWCAYLYKRSGASRSSHSYHCHFKVFDGVSDLIMGYIVDHTHIANGKNKTMDRKTLCIPLAVCTVLMFTVPSFAGSVQIAYMFLTYNPSINSILHRYQRTLCCNARFDDNKPV